ncbi:MAG: Eco47II family restriction endonuclease, partial [Propionibacteriaceae bacterium]|nr:Eco47II family restriction endonuclease [Propionibacteriaceae bacterium]
MSHPSYSYGIDFFSDDVLEGAVSRLLARVDAARQNHDIHKNVIDPFAALFEATHMRISIEDWFPVEIQRQINKSLTNAVGDFHQELIGKLPGWNSTGKSGGVVDLEHFGPFGANGKPAMAEVKNKFNTMSSKTQER